MKNARRGNRAGAEVGQSKNSQTNCPLSRSQDQSFQTIGALSRQVISDLMERHARQLVEV
jgi:hypothetical protein